MCSLGTLECFVSAFTFRSPHKTNLIFVAIHFAPTKVGWSKASKIVVDEGQNFKKMVDLKNEIFLQ